MRSFMLARDSVETVSFEKLFQELLDMDPHNRMAFEYLVADHLLGRRVDKVAADIARLDDFAYPGIPRHYEEALLIYAAKGANLDLHGRSISLTTVERFARFNRLRAKYNGDADAARKGLAREFGDSYFYYYAFGVSG